MTASPLGCCQKGPCAIGVDIGGTKVAVGIVARDGTLSHVAQAATPSDCSAAELLKPLLGLVEQLQGLHPGVAAIGVGAAGIVDSERGRIEGAVNVSYRDFPLQSILVSETGLPAVINNDANAAAWAEACVGAGRGRQHMAVLTVGTGIGAGLVLGGRLYRGATGVGGEVGHMIVNPGGPDCGCGLAGCLETMASGRALARIGRESAAKDAQGTLAKLAGGAENVTGESVFAAARAGDPVAASLFGEIGQWLGIGVALLVTLLDVEIVALGGGLIAAGDLLLGPARTSYANHVFCPPARQPPPIVPAQLAGQAGIVGAGLLALDEALVARR